MNAVCLYIFILGLMAILSFGMSHGTRYQKLCFICAMVLAWFFFALIKPGVDYISYENYYNDFIFYDIIFSDQEPGYVLLNCCLKRLVPNSVIGIAIINTLTIVVSFVAFYLVKDSVDLGMSVFCWFCLQYLSGYLIAMALAAAFVLLGMALLINQKDGKALIAFLIASSLHFSALAVVAFYVCYKIVGNNGKSKLLRGTIIVALLIVISLLPLLFKVAVALLPFLAKYNKYTGSIGHGFGIGQPIFYIPIWYALYYMKRNCSIKDIYRRLYFSFAWDGFAIAMMAYTFGIIDRMFIYFSSSFIFLIPYVIRHHNEHRGELQHSRLSPKTERALFYVYCIMRYALFVFEHYTMSGLNEIVFIWE